MGQFVDVHGYYRTLGVAPTATPEQIKSAYKTKAKQLHPDKNKGPGATGLFRDLVEAYGVLNDPASRRAYDEACRAGVPSGQQARTGGATQAPPPEPEPVPFVACQACGTITPDVRAVLIHWVWSFLYFTRHGSNPAVLCPGCAARFIAQANLRSLLFGWWGVPWGPLITPVQVLRNVFGPRGPADVNARLLIQQAIAYATRHDVHNASKCIMQARRYAAGHPDILRDVEEIARLIPMPPHAKSVDPWSSLSPVFRRVTAFSSGGLAAVAAAVVLLVVQPDVSPGRTSATSVTPDVVAEAEPAAPATSEFAPPAESRSPFGQDVTPDGPQSGYDDETAWNAPVEDVVSNDEQVDSAVSYDSSADTFAGEAASPAETTGEEATPDITPGPPDEPSDAQVTIVPAEEPQPEAAQPPVQAEAPATEPEGTADAASTPAPASTETRPAPRVQPTAKADPPLAAAPPPSPGPRKDAVAQAEARPSGKVSRTSVQGAEREPRPAPAARVPPPATPTSKPPPAKPAPPAVVARSDTPTARASSTDQRSFFTVGDTKDDVLRVMGQPSQLHDDYWVYGMSMITFEGGVVKEWTNTSSNLKAKLIVKPGANKGYFTVGDTKDDVLRVMGQPSQFHDDYWVYGMSMITFEGGVVKEWTNTSSNLKAKLLSSTKATRAFFTVGDTKETVLNVMGQPSQFHDDYWVYGMSMITFEGGVVKEWTDTSSNLKARAQ